MLKSMWGVLLHVWSISAVTTSWLLGITSKTTSFPTLIPKNSCAPEGDPEAFVNLDRDALELPSLIEGNLSSCQGDSTYSLSS